MYDRDSDWKGYMPGCHYISRTLSIQHISLPSNGKCNGKINIIRDVDLCSAIPTDYRWFADVNSILDNDKHAVAVFISRDGYFTKRSILKNHCNNNKNITQLEFDTAKKIIKSALENFPDRTLLVGYELMANFPVHQWHRIEDFLSVPRHEDSFFKPFKNGNI